MHLDISEADIYILRSEASHEPYTDTGRLARVLLEVIRCLEAESTYQAEQRE